MANTPEYALVLRTCKADHSSSTYRMVNGVKVASTPFRWPETGPVKCEDWNPDPCCGGGLHGLLWGEGDWSLLDRDDGALWQVVKVKTADIVLIDQQKIKFPAGEVIY